jgi:hypothetical protein
LVLGGHQLQHILTWHSGLRLTPPTTKRYQIPTPASHSGGALLQACRARLPYASVGSCFRLEEEVRSAKEEVNGKSGLGQGDIKALGGVLESPDIKSPSRLWIYYRSRLYNMAARAFTPPDPIKRNAVITSVANELALLVRPAGPALLAAAYNIFSKIASYDVE